MRRIIPIVEGDGDVRAAPVLLRRILHERLQVFDWEIARAHKANGLRYFSSNASRFLQYAFSVPECAGLLLLFDLDDGCPKAEALQLTQRLQQEFVRAPVAVALAHREFEAWFLASAESLSGQFDLPTPLTYVGEVETRRDAKGWLTDQMPPGKIYKETFHQEQMAARMDLTVAFERSRSFRRLVHALEQVTTAPHPILTP